MTKLGRAAIISGCLVIFAATAQAGDFSITEVDSVRSYALDRIGPAMVVFSDRSRSKDNTGDPVPGLSRFDSWLYTRPDEKQLLAPYPDYLEPTVGRGAAGGRRPTVDKLTMYVSEARFILTKPLSAPDLNKYTTLAFIQNVDPAIQHQRIAPAEVASLTNPKAAHTRNPNRPWCVGGVVVCLRSHYRLEGKLPLAINLANKVRDASKKVADYLEFESELAVRASEELDLARIARLTGLDTPIVGALEQTTFYINQIFQFGKLIIVFQRHPSAANKTVVTAFMAIAVESKLLNSKKEYAKVPVLRNLVPVQVLMGNSSFNSGTSISAGLPNYARSRIRAIARNLDGG